MTRVVIAAGEPSGDRHASHLIKELRRRLPNVSVYGMGGEASRAAGMECWVDIKGMAVIGLIEVLRHYRTISRALQTMKHRLEACRPDILILVDYVEFNLKLASHAKSIGIRVLFYISPQVWAWRSGRAARIRRSVDAMAVLFPFEVEFYKNAGIPVRYVGNPLVDDFEQSGGRERWYPLRDSLAREESRFCIGLLPGSRDSEIERHLDLMLQTAARLRKRLQAPRFILAIAPNLSTEEMVRRRCIEEGIEIIEGGAGEVFCSAHAILTSSGTATLEAGLHAVPMAVIYKTSQLTYLILKRLILIPNIALINIVHGRSIVAEFIQGEANPAALSDHMESLIRNPDMRIAMTESLKSTLDKLGEPGGSARVAQMAIELLNGGLESETTMSPAAN
ncbi:MAG: hypothetical protein RLY67_1041 [Pseudomonadota bacterium]